MSDDLVKRLRAEIDPDFGKLDESSRWGGLIREAADRIEALTAERDKLRRALNRALERLDASLFTNAEHQQAKDILRAALRELEGE